MLLKQFRRTDPQAIFLIVVVLLAIWTGAFIRISDQFAWYFDIDSMPLYGLVASLTGTHPLPGIIASLLLVTIMAFLMVNLNTTLFFINERTFLPALFYILISGLFPHYQLLNPAIFGAVFLMLAVKKIMDSYRIQGTAYNFFDAGLLIGTGALFYAGLLWFGLVAIIGISLIRTLNVREILLTILGIATPFFLATGFYYVAGWDLSGFLHLVEYNLFGRQADFAFEPILLVILALTGAICLIALAHLAMLMGSKKIQSRKTFTLLIWALVIAIGLYFALPSVSVEIVWIAAIPLSYFLPHYFIFARRKVFPEILFAILLIAVAVVQVRYLR